MSADTKPWRKIATSRREVREARSFHSDKFAPEQVMAGRASADLLIGLECSVTVPADGSNGLLAELRTIVQELGLGESTTVE